MPAEIFLENIISRAVKRRRKQWGANAKNHRVPAVFRNGRRKVRGVQKLRNAGYRLLVREPFLTAGLAPV